MQAGRGCFANDERAVLRPQRGQDQDVMRSEQIGDHRGRYWRMNGSLWDLVRALTELLAVVGLAIKCRHRPHDRQLRSASRKPREGLK